jgi:hypothetical protein
MLIISFKMLWNVFDGLRDATEEADRYIKAFTNSFGPDRRQSDTLVQILVNTAGFILAVGVGGIFSKGKALLVPLPSVGCLLFLLVFLTSLTHAR